MRNYKNFRRHNFKPSNQKKGKIYSYFSFLTSNISELSSLKEKLLALFLIITAHLGALIFVLLFILNISLPNVKNPDTLMGEESTIFYDRNGEILYSISKDQVREEVSIEDIPKSVQMAIVAIEDDNFYKHEGIDLGGILKAVLSELGIGKKRGGSTITQQLIKNSLLTSERTYSRKIKEIVLALKIENNFSKDEILEMYLNRIPFGGTAYGVEKAAEVFFGKDAKDLTLDEAAILASLPKAPTYYSPFGNHKNTTLTKDFTLEELNKRKVNKFSDILNNEYSYGLIGSNVSLPNGNNIYLPGRTDEVLKRMADLDFISKEERQLALNKLQNIEFKKYVSNIKAPHFVFYVKEILEKKYGQDVIETGGLQVYTTLDLKQQKVAELAISKQSVINKGLGANNAASISVDAKTGQIISMVGSKDYFNNEIDGSVNIVTSRRQPGSSFKPIVYASAFNRGLNPSNYIFDVPMKLGNNTPKNFDGEFMGPISVKNALALSRNIPAIKAYFVGGEQDEIINLSERLGIRSLDRRSDYGWPLSLGTGELQMIELAQAYSVFANQGKKISLNPILKITDKKGKTLEDYSDSKPTEVEVLSEEVVYLVNSSLSDDKVKLGTKMSLDDGRQVAAKTGTSTKKIGDVAYPSNLWTAGWSKDYVTIAWAGNSDGSKMNLNATGYGGATPIWNEIMNELHLEKEKSEFTQPTSLLQTEISKLSGDKPSKTTPSSHYISGLFIKKFIPNEIDSGFSKAEVDTRNYKTPTRFCPQEFVKELVFWDHLQAEKYTPRLLADRQNEIKNWFLSLEPQQIKDLNLGKNIVIGKPIRLPSELCDPKLANNQLDVEFLNSIATRSLSYGNNKVAVDIISDAGVDRVEFKLNGQTHYTDRSAPYSGNIRISNFIKPNQKVKVSVKVYDINGYSKEIEIDSIVNSQKIQTIPETPEGLNQVIQPILLED